MKKTNGHTICHRTVCNSKADFYNLSTREWYCGECAALIQGYENTQFNPGCIFADFYRGEAKLFIHTGNGHWVGSCIIARVPDMKIAEELISIELDRMGLEDEELNIMEIRTNGIVHSNSGDY